MLYEDLGDRDTEPCAITQKYMNFHKKNIEEREWR
jgi:hypothetical protein